MNDDRLKKLDDKIAQLKAQKQSIINREKEKTRKARTRRLIQNGAIAEKYFNLEDLEPLEFEEEIKKIIEKLNK